MAHAVLLFRGPAGTLATWRYVLLDLMERMRDEGLDTLEDDPVQISARAARGICRVIAVDHAADDAMSHAAFVDEDFRFPTDWTAHSPEWVEGARS